MDLAKANGPLTNPSAQNLNPNANTNVANPVANNQQPRQQQQQQQQQQQPPPLNIRQEPQQPSVHKPWHENITNEMRKHLVQKIIQTIFPTQDHNIYKDPRLANLVGYAVKTECEMYEQAKNQEEYFHLLAERIYKIQKEFEVKTQTRNQIKNPTGQTQMGGSNTTVNNATGTSSDTTNPTASSQQPGNMVNGASNLFSQLKSFGLCCFY